MTATDSRKTDLDLAEAVRAACIEAAVTGYDSAAMSGLCAEGAFEAAVSAIRMLDLKALTDGDKSEPR
ncbi:MAG: acetyltransferase [Gammaproteobacteria bacterium]|nr:acetyltransferase [Gammaproteobacteria bacterium]